MKRVPQYDRFDLAGTRDLRSVEELGELPADRVDGRRQPDQDRRLGHGRDEERDDG